jgi:hypothetical protein
VRYMALSWRLERQGRDAHKTLVSEDNFTDIVQVYEELLLHVFHACGSNIFVENLCFAERNGAVPFTSISVSKVGHTRLRFNDSLSIRAIRNTTRKRQACLGYGITSSVASKLHRMRRKYIKTYCALSQPSFHRLLPLCSSDIRSIFTLDEDEKLWPPLDLTRAPKLPAIAFSSESDTDTDMPELILETADDVLPAAMEAVADDAPANAVEELDVASEDVSPPVNNDDELPELPSESEMDEFFNIADLLSFAIGYWTLANRREVLYQDLESSEIASGIMRGLDHLLAAPICADLALEEFKVAFGRLEESVAPQSELASFFYLSDIQLQLSLLSVDVEAVEAVGTNPDA